MADILIKGLALPRKGDSLMIYVFPSGNVDYKGFHEMETHRTTAMELPPHEHLCEKGAVWDMLHEICVKCNDSGDIDRYPNRCIWCKIKEAYEKVYQTPTVLEASKGRE